MSEERKDYAVLISFMTREEAEVAACALRADGVDAFIGNTHFAYVQWFYQIALGGLQVFVPHRKLVEAKSLLRERIRENAEVRFDEPIGRRDRWKAWLMLVLLYGWPAILPFILNWLAPQEWQWRIEDFLG